MRRKMLLTLLLLLPVFAFPSSPLLTEAAAENNGAIRIENREYSDGTLTFDACSPEAKGQFDDGSLPVLSPGVKMADPGYFTDFWTVPGYLGADPDSSAARDRLQFKGKVRRVHLPGAPESLDEENELESRNGVDDAWKKMLTDGKDAWIELETLPEGEDLYLRGVNIMFSGV